MDQLAAQKPTFLQDTRSKKASRARGAARKAKRSRGSHPTTDDGETKASRLAAHLHRQGEDRSSAKAKRALAATEHHDLLLDKLAKPAFRALFVAVARLFAEQLASDHAALKTIDALPDDISKAELTKTISLASKWAPTPGHSHDIRTNISTAISLLLYDAQVLQSQSASSYRDQALSKGDAHSLRASYQRWVLTPLRRISLIPEPLMSSNRWNEIRYTRVSSICMSINSEHFAVHDEDRFEKYLADVEKGKKKISGASLMPHELVAQAMALKREGGHAYYDGDGDGDELTRKSKLEQVKKKIAESQLRVVETQWKALIQSLHEHGKLPNAIAVCDVSGSMGDIGEKMNKKHPSPIFPAVSLSLVLAQLAEPPFNNGFITFSQNPSFVQLDPTKGLAQAVSEMVRADWGMNTDLEAVSLKLILPLAVKNKINQEDMIKRIFIFSDMQFDQGCLTNSNPAEWATTHDAISKAYQDAGYQVPELVYWNLASGLRTVPVTSDKVGVALMNGFSPALLKVFMGEADADEWEKVSAEGDGETVVAEGMTPEEMMRKAVQMKSYENLVVMD